MLSGLVYGLNVPVLKSSVTSRKLTTFLFASMVILRLFLANMWHILFFRSLHLSWCLIKYRKPVVSVKPDFNARKLF